MDKLCTCGDRHRLSPDHKPGCPRHDPAYLPRAEARRTERERRRVAWELAPRLHVVRREAA